MQMRKLRLRKFTKMLTNSYNQFISSLKTGNQGESWDLEKDNQHILSYPGNTNSPSMGCH